MTSLDGQPYGARDEGALLDALDALTRHHLAGCAAYARVWPDYARAETLDALPWLHARMFKHVDLRTGVGTETAGRVLRSSSTTGAQPSRVHLDARSSALQARSAEAILRDFVGAHPRCVVVLDSAASVRAGREVSARVASAMALRPLARDMVYALADAQRPETLRWDALRSALREHDELIVHGVTWALWLAWSRAPWPDDVASMLRRTRVTFVHSGGWKRLDALAVSSDRFDATLRASAAPGSTVVDCYGLVEQNGVVFPSCAWGYRHVPRWADVLARDPYDLRACEGRTGMLQLVNTLAWGAPYHSVLTEDLGLVEPTPCPCGRSGRRFVLQGRVPAVEVRGCGNV